MMIAGTISTQSKIPVHLEEIEETALLSLYIRYLETLRLDRILKDSSAVEMIRKLSFDFSKWQPSCLSALGEIIVTRLIDLGVMNFLELWPNATVINLGAGLCSRFQRLDHPLVRWYDIDLPGISQLRSKFFQSSDRYQWIAGSFLNRDWLNLVDIVPEQPVLIVMERSSMFLTAIELRTLIESIQTRCSHAELLMDICGAQDGQYHWEYPPFMDGISPNNWGVEATQTLENWNLGLQVLEENYYLTYLKHFSSRINALKYSMMMNAMPLIKHSCRLIRVGWNSRYPPIGAFDH